MGIGGAIAFALGSMMIFDGDVPGFELDISVVIAATAVTGLIIFIALTTALRSFRARTVSGDQGLQDETGTVLNWSGKTGEIMIHSERWHAVADEALAPGDSVRVLAREGLNLRVAPMAQAGSDRKRAQDSNDLNPNDLNANVLRRAQMPIDFAAYILLAALIIVVIGSAIKIMREYERAVVFTPRSLHGREGARSDHHHSLHPADRAG